MTIFDFKNYRLFLKFRLKILPKGGYGQAKKMAMHIAVSTTLISQILAGKRDFTPEQAYGVAEYLGLNEIEMSVFIKLVQLERAGHVGLKNTIQKEIDILRKQSEKLSEHLTHQKVMNDEQRGRFYSDWHYSAIRLLTSIPQYNNVEVISSYFGLPKKIVIETLNFLVSAGLVVEKNGHYEIGPLSTHLEADSQWIKSHHTNWRHKALDYIKHQAPDKIHYSSPMTLGKTDVMKIKKILLKAIGEAGKIVDPSPCEKLMCLNIDWFEIEPKP